MSNVYTLGHRRIAAISYRAYTNAPCKCLSKTLDIWKLVPKLISRPVLSPSVSYMPRGRIRRGTTSHISFYLSANFIFLILALKKPHGETCVGDFGGMYSGHLLLMNL